MILSPLTAQFSIGLNSLYLSFETIHISRTPPLAAKKRFFLKFKLLSK